MERKKILLIMIAAAVALSASAPAAIPAAAENDGSIPAICPDATYMFAQRDTCELFMDVYEPAEGSETQIDGKEKPTVIFMFGGGFITGRRDEPSLTPWYRNLAENGYRVIAIDYRLGLKGVNKVGVAQVNVLDRAIHMAVEDLFSATVFIIGNAETLGVDPDNIVISGTSAGAITVLQADYELCNRTRYAELLPEDFHYAGVISFSGGILSRKGKLKYAEEPAPTIMFHGTGDRLVNYGQIKFFNLGFFGSDKIAKRFSKFGYNYNIVRYKDYGHEIAASLNDNLAFQFRFLEENVMRKEKFILDATVEDPSISRMGKMTRKSLYGN